MEFARIFFRLSAFLLLGTGCVHPLNGMAAESGPRAYSNAPNGLNVLQLLHSVNKKESSYDLLTNSDVLYYYKYLGIAGKNALIGGYIPYSDAKLTLPSSTTTLTQQGVGDPTFVIGIDLLGAPSMARDDFKQYQQDTIIGASMTITAPLGKYDETSPLNVSSNRWTVKSELALSKAVHRFIIDLYGNYTIYTTNDGYYAGTLDQDARLGMDAHFSYTIMRGTWVSADLFRNWGGETTVNGTSQNNAANDTTYGMTAKVPLSRQLRLQAKYRQTNSANSDATSHSTEVRFQYLW